MSTCPLVVPLGPRSGEDVWRQLLDQPHVAFLDSALQMGELSRYSFVSADPIQWITQPARSGQGIASLSPWVAQMEAWSAADGASQDPPHSVCQTRSVEPAMVPSFQGGVIALFGYEWGADFEQLPIPTWDEFALPALHAGLYDVVVVVDHVQGQATLYSQGWPETNPARRQSLAQVRANHFLHLLSRGHVEPRPTGHASAPRLLQAPVHTTPRNASLTSNFSATEYQAAVAQAVEYIRAGDIFQVNLAQRLLHRATRADHELYAHLRIQNPAPFGCYLDVGSARILSASPERFLKVSQAPFVGQTLSSELGPHDVSAAKAQSFCRARYVETRPIKGTRPLRQSPEANLLSGMELQASVKDRAENVMIVDLLRNDLSRVCLPTSVRVQQLWGLEKYAFVQHLVSVVHGELKPEQTSLDLLAATFPGGSVTGAPKIRAMEIITELERVARGAYCGCVGYLGPDGAMDVNILIRTIISADGWWQLPVGGGIVAASQPASEYAETWHKAEGLLRAIER